MKHFGLMRTQVLLRWQHVKPWIALRGFNTVRCEGYDDTGGRQQRRGALHSRRIAPGHAHVSSQPR